MQMGMDLSLTQTQKLIITPEFRQAIAILQLQSQELEHFIEEALLENPFLDLTEDGDEESAPAEQEDEEKFDIDWQEYFADGRDLGYTERGETQEGVPFEQIVRGSTSLHDDLLMQWRLTIKKSLIGEIGEYLIGNLDENGYLKIEPEEVAAFFQTSLEKILETISLIQELEPIGIGAKNLQECLLLQLERIYGEQPLAKAIIENYLEDLAAGRIPKIARELDTTPVEVQEAGDLIKTLNPRPASGYLEVKEAETIYPDVVVRKIAGEYIVLVNDNMGPRLRVSPQYRKLLTNEGEFETKDRKFLEERLQGALWIIRSIEQRRLTLYRVVNCIVELQKDFLEEGVKKLKPLTLRDVAEELEIHESTVSRAIANKYVQTPRGMFELNYFFASGVEKTSGKAISSESIKKRMKELIDAEDKSKPLTDQALTNLLQKEGVKISRRTVAKYREELGLWTASRRRRF